MEDEGKWSLRAVTHKLSEWLQHIPGRTSDISVTKSILGKAKMLGITFKLTSLLLNVLNVLSSLKSTELLNGSTVPGSGDRAHLRTLRPPS